MMKNYLLAFAILLTTAGATACSFPVSSVDQQVENAEEIFIATLLEAKLMPADERHKWRWIEGRFQVAKALKGGAQPKELILTTGLGRSDCGVGMTVSWKYIIFKGRNETGIGAPSGTHLIEDFQEDELAKEIQSIVQKQQTKAKRK